MGQRIFKLIVGVTGSCNEYSNETACVCVWSHLCVVVPMHYEIKSGWRGIKERYLSIHLRGGEGEGRRGVHTRLCAAPDVI